MSISQQDSWRRWVAIPLSIMILFALLLAGMAQAGASSCTSAPPADRVGHAGFDEPVLSDVDGTPKQTTAQAKFACCSVSCPIGFVAVVGADDTPVVLRHGAPLLSGQSPDTLATDGPKRPPRSIRTDYGRA